MPTESHSLCRSVLNPCFMLEPAPSRSPPPLPCPICFHSIYVLHTPSITYLFIVLFTLSPHCWNVLSGDLWLTNVSQAPLMAPGVQWAHKILGVEWTEEILPH